MTKELDPCPFCGCHPTLSVETGFFKVSCPNCDCPAYNDNWFESEHEATNAWNARYKRTCKPHVVERHIQVEGEECSLWQAVCDCGWIVGEDGIPNLSEFEHVDNFCGNCGMEMVVDGN